MTVTSDVVFLSGLDLFGSVVDRMPPSAWSEPSPCDGWTALDVLGHLGTAIGFGVAILDGRTYDWPTFDRPADLVDGAPATYWTAIAARARAAIDGVDLEATRETPMGVRTVAEGLAFPAVDLFVHAWDIGRAGGIDVEVPDDVIGFAHGFHRSHPPGDGPWHHGGIRTAGRCTRRRNADRVVHRLDRARPADGRSPGGPASGLLRRSACRCPPRAPRSPLRRPSWRRRARRRHRPVRPPRRGRRPWRSATWRRPGAPAAA